MYKIRWFVLIGAFCLALPAGAEEVETVTVTARRRADVNPVGEGPGTSGALSPVTGPGEQPSEGASSTVDLADLTKGFRFRFTEFNFTIEISAEDRARMGERRFAALLKALTDYKKSPDLTRALQHIHNQGASSVVIHYGRYMHEVNGTTKRFPEVSSSISPSDAVGYVSYFSRGKDMDTTIAAGTVVHVSINSEYSGNMTARLFVRGVIHELLHPMVPGIDNTDENEVERLEDIVYDNIFKKSGMDELAEGRSPENYAGIVARGSAGNDTLFGRERDDSLYGGSGDDALYGSYGEDSLYGGDGRDTLYGGMGSDWLEGGQGHDVYYVSDEYLQLGAIADHDIIADTGGVDMVILRDMNIVGTQFWREGDTLFIKGANGHVVQIDRQWVPGFGIEDFQFADGFYYASHIETLAMGGVPGDGTCYTEDGFPYICE